MAGDLKVSEVAALARVTADTVHYYERLGLLPAPPRDRTTAGAQIQPLALEVVGVFDAEFTFGNAQVFLPASWPLGSDRFGVPA